jgi:hypothetical protein
LLFVEHVKGRGNIMDNKLWIILNKISKNIHEKDAWKFLKIKKNIFERIYLEVLKSFQVVLVV